MTSDVSTGLWLLRHVLLALLCAGIAVHVRLCARKCLPRVKLGAALAEFKRMFSHNAIPVDMQSRMTKLKVEQASMLLSSIPCALLPMLVLVIGFDYFFSDVWPSSWQVRYLGDAGIALMLYLLSLVAASSKAYCLENYTKDQSFDVNEVAMQSLHAAGVVVWFSLAFRNFCAGIVGHHVFSDFFVMIALNCVSLHFRTSILLNIAISVGRCCQFLCHSWVSKFSRLADVPASMFILSELVMLAVLIFVSYSFEHRLVAQAKAESLYESQVDDSISDSHATSDLSAHFHRVDRQRSLSSRSNPLAKDFAGKKSKSFMVSSESLSSNPPSGSGSMSEFGAKVPIRHSLTLNRLSEQWDLGPLSTHPSTPGSTPGHHGTSNVAIEENMEIGGDGCAEALTRLIDAGWVSSSCCLARALSLVRNIAKGGTLLVIAPTPQVVRLQGHVRIADEGYLTRRLKDVHISSQEFETVLEAATEHTDNDRWPEDCADEEARGQPKDGAIVLTTEGYRWCAAAKLIGLPTAPYSWPGVGTRHEAALQVACFLEKCVVMVRSDSGKVHVLSKRQEELKILRVHSTEPEEEDVEEEDLERDSVDIGLDPNFTRVVTVTQCGGDRVRRLSATSLNSGPSVQEWSVES